MANLKKYKKITVTGENSKLANKCFAINHKCNNKDCFELIGLSDYWICQNLLHGMCEKLEK